MAEKIIILDTSDNFFISEADFKNPHGFNRTIYQIIGNECQTYQVIPCTFLNHHFRTSYPPQTKEKIGYVMLIDDEGKLKDNEMNYIASMFYANPNDFIAGKAVIVGVKMIGDLEWDMCGVDEECISLLKSIVAGE